MTRTVENIVIIDDEKRMCDSLQALLSGDGYKVGTFQDSTEAVEAIRKGGIDLVITDIKMPGLTGLDVLEAVQEVEEKVPVILMTGFASLDSALEAIQKGAYDYLLKPVEFTQLELAVSRALEKRRTDLSRMELVEELKISNMILERRVSELNALFEAGKSIGSSTNIQELLRKLVALAAKVTESSVGSIMLLSEDRTYLTIEAAIGLDTGIMRQTRVPVGESIAGHVAKIGEPLVIDDVENDRRFKRINKERYGKASLLCVPLKIKNRVIGVVNMANKTSGAIFSRNDMQLLTTFASQAAVAVDDANQFEKNRRRLVEFEILFEMSDEMAGIDSVNVFRAVLVEKLRRVFPIDRTLWFNVDSSTGALVAASASGFSEIPLTNSGGIDLRQVGREMITVEQINLDTQNYDDIGLLTAALKVELDKHPNFRSPDGTSMAIPIVSYGQLASVLYLGAEGPEEYSEQDIKVARLVVSQSAILFERERSLLNATRLLTMGNMISEISHDLRKPLTSLRGGLQIVRKRWPEVAEGSDFFINAEQEVLRMNELVRELVDFSNPNKYQTEKTDLRKVVSRAAELVKPDLRKHNIEFTTDFAAADWEIILNKNQILEALLNLYINAIDSMPDGGSLTVKGIIERPEHKKVDYLALRISDTGVGVAPGNLSKLFDRYFTTKETGTGLGLAVVERIISAHSGTLKVDSTEGEGTSFTLYFPLQ